jgi:hypothetical protein
MLTVFCHRLCIMVPYMYLAILTVRSRSVHQEVAVSYLCSFIIRSNIYLKV